MNLKQLSKHLGLSQTTVSRGLNGYPEVSERTRQRIREAAEKYNYAPSSVAKGLATGRVHTVGHVTSISDNNEILNPIFGDFLAGAGETYASNNYEMILSVVPAGKDECQVYRDLKSRNAVDGVVIQSPRKDDPRIPLLLEIGLPFVVHGRDSSCTLPYSWLDMNNRSAFQRATDFLLDLGHRRIGFLNGDETLNFAARRREGYEDALKSRGVALDGDLVVADEMTEEFGFEQTLDMLSNGDAPTAILTSSILIALGARRAIEAKGRVMGRDVSVITHDDCLSYLKNGKDVPIFTSTRSSVRQAGGQLAEMLLQRIASPLDPPTTILLEADLTLGRSTGPVRIS